MAEISTMTRMWTESESLRDTAPMKEDVRTAETFPSIRLKKQKGPHPQEAIEAFEETPK